MKKRYNGNRGITLVVLAVYIISLLLVLALLTMVTTSFKSSLNKMRTEASDIIEYDKFNIQLLKEAKRDNNYVQKVSLDRTTIQFTSGNKYQFIPEESSIYITNTNVDVTLKLAADYCDFSMYQEAGKTIIMVNMTIGNIEREMRYVMASRDTLA